MPGTIISILHGFSHLLHNNPIKYFLLSIPPSVSGGKGSTAEGLESRQPGSRACFHNYEKMHQIPSERRLPRARLQLYFQPCCGKQFRAGFSSLCTTSTSPPVSMRRFSLSPRGFRSTPTQGWQERAQREDLWREVASTEPASTWGAQAPPSECFCQAVIWPTRSLCALIGRSWQR